METIKYLFFGALTSVVNFGSFAVAGFLLGEDYYLLSNIVSFVVATLFAFVTNKLFVFNSRSREWDTVIKELCSFVSARIVSFLLIEELGLFVAVSIFYFNSMASKVVLAFVAVFANYLLSKFVIFKKVNR